MKLRISMLFLHSLNSELPASTKLSVTTLPTSKDSWYFFLAKITVMLYERVVATLALLK